MYYDKHTKTFHKERDKENVVAHLHWLITNVEKDTLGVLTLNMLGDAFGNEFWDLIYPDPSITRPVCRRCGYVD